MTTMLINKYPGTCTGCGIRVEAGAGFYDYGNVWCEEPTVQACLHTCPRDHAREAIRRRKSADLGQGQKDRTFVSEFDDVNEKIASFWAEKDQREADPVYQAEKKARAEKRQREEETWARQGLRRCPRCGGAGRSDRWIATGSTCYECEGHGAIPK